MIKNDIYINSTLLLLGTFVAISSSYYYLFSTHIILNIIKEEYILIGFVIFSFILHLYMYFKLKKYDIIPFIPKLGKIPLFQSIIFFTIFEIVDYFYEDGIMGAIKLWYMYWLFGILSLNIMYIFNYYKNIKFYNTKLL